MTAQASPNFLKKQCNFIEEETADSPMKTHTAQESLQKKKQVRKAYSVIRKHTGTLGGDGSGGPIYGEITERCVYTCETEVVRCQAG